MRADAKRNFEHLISVARDAIAEHGAEASLRDIARRAGVGLATLYRHFPTREALLDILLRTDLDALTLQADALLDAPSPDAALVEWFGDALHFTRTYAGAVALMAAALDDEGSALHASCVRVRAAGAELLRKAQSVGTARADIDGTELFALMAALAWIGDQPALTAHTERLSAIVLDGILPFRAAPATG